MIPYLCWIGLDRWTFEPGRDIDTANAVDLLVRQRVAIQRSKLATRHHLSEGDCTSIIEAAEIVSI